MPTRRQIVYAVIAAAIAANQWWLSERARIRDALLTRDTGEIKAILAGMGR